MTPLLTSQGDAGKLDELIERVSRATGPDRSIDIDLARTEGWTQHTDEADPVYTGKVSTWWAEPGQEWSTTSVPPAYTASIDAALALAKRVLPNGWRWYVDDRTAAVWPDGTYDDSDVSAATPPLAIILATLRALKTLSGDSHG